HGDKCSGIQNSQRDVGVAIGLNRASLAKQLLMRHGDASLGQEEADDDRADHRHGVHAASPAYRTAQRTADGATRAAHPAAPTAAGVSTRRRSMRLNRSF